MNFSEQVKKRGTFGRHHHFANMLVMGESPNLWIMRGVVVTENKVAACILPVIAITEPGERAFLDHESFADFQDGAVRELEPDAEVSSGSCEEFLAIPVDLGARERLDRFADLPEILCGGEERR